MRGEASPPRPRFLFLFTLLLVASLASAAAQAETRIILLGTGTPNADPERWGPATAIVVDEEIYLVDCGPGVVRRAAAARLDVRRLKRVFITHLHSDHTLGLPDLMFSPWTLGRTEALEIYGPKGVRAMAGHIRRAYEQDINIRVEGLEPANATGYAVTVQEIREGVVYRDAHVTVKAFRVPHGSWREAYGFRFETPERTIVISGDTTASAAVRENARGADVLIHEVYSTAGFARRPPEWQRYHAAFHTSSRELARLAAEARPSLLLLYHCLFWGTSEEELLGEIRELYDGKVVVGRDLGVY